MTLEKTSAAALKSEAESAETETPEEEIARLEAEIVAFSAERAECETKVKTLRAAENPAAGIFHNAEIFELGQRKLTVDTEIMHRRNKINRIKYFEATFGAARPN